MKQGQIIFSVFAVVVLGVLVYMASTRERGVSVDSYDDSMVQTEPELGNAMPDTLPINEQETMADITPINETVQVTMTTSLGVIELELDGSVAPKTVGNFVQLANAGFYNGTTFHRVIPDFMIQGGDPLSKDPSARAVHGTGDPGYKFEDEFNSSKVVRGVIAMANSGPNTNGSQFFIVTGEAFPHLDGRHTVFGKVTSGMDVVDAISAVPADQADNPLEPVVVESVVVSQ